ncbi:unnamed protein product [Schistosoma margrebowiei]|uniref:Uncharacterized protein n=1 Tax=Schistosoma margrebowiei TaxID=48269 RepID=A0A183MHX6_9TREM|nr:unnamed protein product [Schistosoma margrebowiei]
MKLKLKTHCATGKTAVQNFNTAFLRDTSKTNQFKITQQEVVSLTRYTERCYDGGQLRRDQRSTKLNVSGGAGPQEASS